MTFPSTAAGAGVHHVLRARVIEREFSPAHGQGEKQWDVSARVELSHHVRLQGGEATVGLTATGLLLPVRMSDLSVCWSVCLCPVYLCMYVCISLNFIRSFLH